MRTAFVFIAIFVVIAVVVAVWVLVGPSISRTAFRKRFREDLRSLLRGLTVQQTTPLVGAMTIFCREELAKDVFYLFREASREDRIPDVSDVIREHLPEIQQVLRHARETGNDQIESALVRAMAETGPRAKDP
jgi:hypothetical protein